MNLESQSCACFELKDPNQELFALFADSQRGPGSARFICHKRR